MKRFLLALVAAVAVSAPALADEALAKANKCTTCHAVDKTKVGPSYKDIAKKFAGQKDAADKLAVAIVKGVGGMPPQPQVNAADAKKLATWIMSVK